MMKRVQVSPGQYISVSSQAQDRARRVFARVAYTKTEADRIAQTSSAEAQMTVLAGSRKKLHAMADEQPLAA